MTCSPMCAEHPYHWRCSVCQGVNPCGRENADCHNGCDPLQGLQKILTLLGKKEQ